MTEMVHDDRTIAPEPASGVTYQANPPMFRNHPFLFILAVCLIPVFGLGVAILVVWYIYCQSTTLHITDEYIVYEVGILSKRRSEINRDTIRTVIANQSFFQRIMDTGDLEIYTAGDEPELVTKGMPSPNELRALLRP